MKQWNRPCGYDCPKRSPCLSTWDIWSRRYVVIDEPSMALLFLAWLWEPLFYAVCLAAEAHGILLELLSLLLANKYWRNCISPCCTVNYISAMEMISKYCVYDKRMQASGKKQKINHCLFWPLQSPCVLYCLLVTLINNSMFRWAPAWVFCI